MTSHLARILEHLELERQAMVLEAKRAQVLDNSTNRGTQGEQTVLRWLRASLAPDYAVASGEIVDSFDTNADVRSRQQDVIVYKNDRHANQFVLPSGLRLVPVESLAAVVEVKLSLNAAEFQRADTAAEETQRLRLRARDVEPRTAGPFRVGNLDAIPCKSFPDGIPLNAEALGRCRPTFAVFSFRGISDPTTLGDYLKKARGVNVVCCLEGGCAVRFPGDKHARITSATHALAMFGHFVRNAAYWHDALMTRVDLDFSGYAGFRAAHYWDESGVDHPAWFNPGEENIADTEWLREQLIRKL